MMYQLIKPFLFLLRPETAHHVGLWGLKILGHLHRMSFWSRPSWADHGSLERETPFGEVTSPIGVAAGFDKNAVALWGWQALGFGFVEVGTATPVSQPGNPLPRLFRLPKEKAIINRMGFNNDGAEVIAGRVALAKKQGLTIKVGGNIGKNKMTPVEKASEDYRLAARAFKGIVDYFVVNVSSPNTPGLRDLQTEKALHEILSAVRDEIGDAPLFIKIAPDHYTDFIEGVLNVAQEFKLAGVICGNTVANHGSALTGWDGKDVAQLPQGGLSGTPIFKSNLELCKTYARREPSLFVIGVGGITSHKEVNAYLEGGAKLVQIYSGFIYRGPSVLKEVLLDLKRVKK